jgi:hypothetical protein
MATCLAKSGAPSLVTGSNSEHWLTISVVTRV